MTKSTELPPRILTNTICGSKKSFEESCWTWPLKPKFEVKSIFRIKLGQIYFDEYKQNDIFCQDRPKKCSFRHQVVSLETNFLVEKMRKEFLFTNHI